MKIKSISILAFLLVLISYSCKNETVNSEDSDAVSETTSLMAIDSTDATNDFYDNSETILLPGDQIEVLGEVSNPGFVNFSKLPLRSVMVKETRLGKYGNMFTGAFRYDGYSLQDILNERILQKKNADSFKPIVDLYVEIENDKGEKTVISWGELYYNNHLDEIIIATRVSRVVPSKAKTLWELPTEAKLVVVGDLLTERNITNPTKITVKSYPIELEVEKGKFPLYSATCDFMIENKKVATLKEHPADYPNIETHTIFYGRGRGLHSTDPFTGLSLNAYLSDVMEETPKAIREGIFIIAADDGYRAMFTYSEICNRNDQGELLLICRPEVETGGIFRIIPCFDFFSDRAIKGINTIYYSENLK
ncbi:MULTISPECIES: hypothetical protein [unclassified Lentimicrobium]|uniref:hypothetical protein n=1 Tax=unclassified Lentimicrobium TaxID=2677434 RepID=UPI0015573255|nr:MULTISPECIES: hypothetical protein [unclassified Lentimicrobium]NPD45144.1 hypothetical protein [Lentimicrobium sp. S6]NPD86558.1 hypothetical protein [Lentimicrobium sp. L6]